jgi:hypothetical protein
MQLIYYTDNLVVGFFISASAVTFYAIGGSLLEDPHRQFLPLRWFSCRWPAVSRHAVSKTSCDVY